jgi:TPR repeat protein
MCQYGFILSKGDGIATDQSRAAQYYKLVADFGNARAQILSGHVLPNSHRIEANHSLAAHYTKL